MLAITQFDCYNKRITKLLMAFKNKNIVREFPFFTHFATIPFLKEDQRNSIKQIQQIVRQVFTQHKYDQTEEDVLKEHSHLLSHVTLFKLTLKRQEVRKKLSDLLKTHSDTVIDHLNDLFVHLIDIKYFTRFNKNAKCNEITVIYLEIDKSSLEKLNKLADFLLRLLLKEEIIATQELKSMNVCYDHTSNMFRPETFHVSLFRARNLMEDQRFLEAFQKIQNKINKLQFCSDSFHISTMQQYNQAGFYLPFYQICKKQINEQKMKIETSNVQIQND